MTQVRWIAIAASFVAVGVAGVVMYAVALNDDELSSRLPVGLQIAMGKDPHSWTWPYCFETDPVCYPMSYGRKWWDRETYLRSQNRDTTDVCYEGYKKFVSQIVWLRGNGYWPEFMNICKIRPVDTTIGYLLISLPHYVSEACMARIDSGWTVGSDGTFYPPNPRAPARMDFVAECLPPSSTGRTNYIHPTMYPLPYLGY